MPHPLRSPRAMFYDSPRSSVPSITLITLRTRAGRHSFGQRHQGGIDMSHIGRIVTHYWCDIPRLRRNVFLDAWLMTPDQLHGIVIVRPSRDAQDLGLIINQFKGACTRHIHAAGYGGFAWHEGFYARSIETETALLRIRQSLREHAVLVAA